jgi:hypothetical protein
LVRVSEPAEEESSKAIQDETQANGSLFVVPNPVTGEAEIQYIVEELWEIAGMFITNSSGQEVYSTALTNSEGSQRVDCSNWPNGIYFVILRSRKGQTVSTRFSIVH